MTTSKIKNRIVQLVSQTSDPEMLQCVESLLNASLRTPDFVLQGIAKGKENIKNGNWKYQEEFVELYKKWQEEFNGRNKRKSA